MQETFSVDFKDFKQAFLDRKITFEQMVEVLIDNFGSKNTKIFLKKNLKRCFKYEHKEYLRAKEHLDLVLGELKK